MNYDWIDITLPMWDGMVRWPGDAPFQRTMTMEIANGDPINLSQIATSVHMGTHMDAPLHFIADGKSIDAMPLSATIGPARVIGIEDPEAIRVSELARYKIAKGERILFRTAKSGFAYRADEFYEDYVYINPEAAEYLAAIPIQTVGVDYLSVGGFHSGNVETHRALLGAGIWIIEGLNLEHVEPGNYEMICLPLKLMGAEGAPARAVLRRI